MKHDDIKTHNENFNQAGSKKRPPDRNNTTDSKIFYQLRCFYPLGELLFSFSPLV
jgi:hypothetical protein